MAPSTAIRDTPAEMELWEHLQELRVRLIRSLAYLALGLAAGWVCFPVVFALLWTPMVRVLSEHPGWQPVLADVTQAFTLRLQIAFWSGLLLALPLITLEAWGFLAPGLTGRERRVCAAVFPASVALFFLGAAYGYALIEPALRWFASHVPPHWIVLQSPVPYLTFLVKMVVGFGVAFQTPAVVLLLAWLGLVTFDGLRRSWRAWLVGSFALAAVATPGGDALVMVAMALPLTLLYGVCLGGCWLLEWVRRR